jgi:uncharacterized iron-regulated protein
MKKLSCCVVLFITLFLGLQSFRAAKPAYVVYNSLGKQVDYDSIVAVAKDADMVFFGELHDNPICHWLELCITKDLYKFKNANLILGAEMFESDNQLLLNEYLQGKIKDKNFADEAKLWPNYVTDYKPLIEFAKENKLSFVASNVPRRYASMVNAKGFESLDSLDAEAKEFIAPLPVNYNSELACYKSMLKMAGMGGMHANLNLPKAQALKDATMAYFIYNNWKAGKVFLHFNGSYHSDNYEGIVWYLKQADKNLKIVTISSVEQEDINTLESEYKGKADYIICIPSDMTKTQ